MRRGRRPSSAHVAGLVRESPARAEPHDPATWFPLPEVLPDAKAVDAAREVDAQPSPARAEPHDETTWLPLPDIDGLPSIHELLEPGPDGPAPAPREISVTPSPARAEPHDATAWLPLPDVTDVIAPEDDSGRPRRHRRPRVRAGSIGRVLVGLLVVASLVGGYFAVQQFFDAGDDVDLRVDGRSISAETGVRTVRSFLKEQRVKLGEHDRVTPAAATPIENGMTVRVFRAFPVTLDFDGKTSTVYTTFTSPADALKSLTLGNRVVLRDPPARIEANSTLVARTRKIGTLLVDGHSANYDTPSRTVQELLDKFHVVLGPDDFSNPPATAVLPDNTSVAVTRVGNPVVPVNQPYTVPDQDADDPNLPVGEKRVERGAPGVQTVSYQVTVHDNQVVDRKIVSIIPVKGHEARPTITYHGAKYDPRWDKIAQCETGGNWSFRGAAYSGGLGIYHGTWSNFGGREFARVPSGATKLQQIEVAERIRKKYGFTAWGCGKMLHYR